MNVRMQRTIAQPVTFEGTGLHTGERGTVTFRPAPANSGVRFVRVDLPGYSVNLHFYPAAGR